MRSTHRSVVAAFVAFVAVSGTQAADAADAYDRPGRNELVSVSSASKQMRYPLVGFFTNTEFSDITPNGRYVAFSTDATGLAAGDERAVSATAYRVYVRDRRARRTVQASTAADGSQQIAPVYGSRKPTVSANGRYVAFESGAINLVAGDTNNESDVFVKDLRTGRVKRVSVSSRGTQGDRGGGEPSISPDGRYVAFASSSRNLISAATAGMNVFRHDLKTGKTVLVSANLKGKPANHYSEEPSISADGRYVAFNSNARDIVRNDTTADECECDARNVFRRDMKTGKTVRVSVASDGSQASFGALPSCRVGTPSLITLPPGSPIGQIGGAGASLCDSGVGLSPRFISANGRYVGFGSDASNLVPNDSNAASFNTGVDLFVHDVKTGRTERVSVDSYGHEQSGGFYFGGVSSNGRYVHYSRWTIETRSAGSQDPIADLLSSGVGYVYRSHVYDRASGSMELTSRPMSGKAPTLGRCLSGEIELAGFSPRTWAGGISTDGRYAAMRSNITNLVGKDTNDGCDFFVRDRGSAVGVGGFGGEGSGPASDDATCVTNVCLQPLAQAYGDSVRDVGDAAADLVGASAVYRPTTRDLFVRLDVARMSAVAGVAMGGPLYGLRFTANGERYEVRAQRVPGADFDPKGGASVGLFRQDAVTGLFAKVATLKGGYGTTGPSVVVAVPLKALGSVARLADVRAFTALGSYDVGATRLLDSIRLSR